MEQSAFRQCLAKKLAEIKSRDRQYSLRKFAKDLEQPPSVISEILSGKRTVSIKNALTIAQKAGFTPAEVHTLKVDPTVRAQHDVAFTDLAFDRDIIDIDQYDLVAGWEHFSILSLIETEDFRSNTTWIAKRLNITRAKATAAIERLLNLGYIEKAKNKKFKLSSKPLSTSDGIASMALRKRHEENLSSARSSLYKDELNERDFTFMNIALDIKRLPEIKSKIRRFINELSLTLEKDKKDEVYEICIQMFPRTKVKKINHAKTRRT